MSGYVSTFRVKTAIETIPQSTLTILFDTGIPGGTTARVEVSPEKGLIQPKLFILTADSEVEGYVYGLMDGVERLFLSVDENEWREVDVDEFFDEVMVKKLILQAKTKKETTDLRNIALHYSGGIFEYR
jgi:hypothetical protein